jgi:drug/metabolite transporter (DMT)-like permease
MIKNTEKYGIFLALLSAVLYALSTPFSKILLEKIPSTMMAGLLYIGAGIGMGAIAFFRKKTGRNSENGKFTKAEMPYVFAMILLDIAAPISLMFGLRMTSAANASLLNNFEYVATALIAFSVFHEKISRRLLSGICFTVFSCALLSFEGSSSLDFSKGSALVLLSAILWGIENNCTRALSEKDPMIIVLLKGIFCGGTSFVLALILGERTESFLSIVFALILGLVSYGLSIFVFVYAQRYLGAAKTSVYSAATPFVATVISLIVFREIPEAKYYIALLLMIFGAFLSSSDEPIFKKK